MRLSDANISVDVNELAKQLAKIAGPIAQHGWEVYVRQQYVIGVQEVIAAIVLVILTAMSVVAIRVVLARMSTDKAEHDNREEEIERANRYYPAQRFDSCGYWGLLVTFAISGLIFLFAALLVALDAFGHLSNPEYGAIQGILGR